MYNSTEWLRVGVAAVPFVGGSIDALITTRAGKLVERRITALLDELRTTIGRLAEEKIDKDYVGSEEWDDLIIRSLRAAAETSDAEKIRLYAAILTGASQVHGLRDELDPLAILSAVAELSPGEVILARSVYANTAAGASVGSDTDRDFHLKRIERTGLIRSEVSAGFGGATTEFRPTSTFTRLMEFLEKQPS